MWKIDAVSHANNIISVRLSNVIDNDEVNSKTLNFTNTLDSDGNEEKTREVFLEGVKQEIDALLIAMNFSPVVKDITQEFVKDNG